MKTTEPPPLTRSVRHNDSTTAAMNEGAVLMREVDADILEKGVKDSCSTASTPLCGSSHPSLSLENVEMLLTPFKENEPLSIGEPLLPRSQDGASLELSESFGTNHSRSLRACLFQTHSEESDTDASSRALFLRNDGNGFNAHHESSSMSLASVMPQPSCDSFDKQLPNIPLHERARSFPGFSGSSIPAQPIGSPARSYSVTKFDRIEDNSGVHPTYQRFGSSKSIDRKLNEAAQYAEAVGEMPPTDEHGIVREIIEDNSSDDDDDDYDDEINIRVHGDTEEVGADHSIHSTVVAAFDRREMSLNDVNDELVDGDILRFELSKSLDRKLNESKQYIEAVGEVPAAGEIREIIEDGDTDDDVDEECPEINLTHTEEQKSAVNDDDFIKVDVHDAKSMSPRPRWPFGRPYVKPVHTFKHLLPDSGNTIDFKYRGICANPPEITKRGLNRGNIAQLHRKAWLEVSDKYHRYGKNLRLYYKRWEELGHPTNTFFDWLDSKGEAAGEPLPNLPECPRSQLDSDTVLYITNDELQASYRLQVVPDDEGNARIVDSKEQVVDTGPDGWIFVLRDQEFYGAQKVTSINGKSKQRFHHSSFFGGKAVAAAGILITDCQGRLQRLYPHSGHYRPGEAHMQRTLFFLQHRGVELSTFEVDTQQLLHVSRTDKIVPKGGVVTEEVKKTKLQSLHIKPAVYVACFLAHKALMLGAGVFDKIHMIRKVPATTVTEILDEIDEGGFWKKIKKELAELELTSQSNQNL